MEAASNDKVVTMPAPSGADNIVYGDNCANLQNVSVQIVVTEDLILSTTANDGFSIQLNAFPQSGFIYQGESLTLLQFIVYVTNGAVTCGVQYCSGQQTPIVISSSADPANVIGLAPANKIAAGGSSGGGSLIIGLLTDPYGNVVMARFGYNNADGNYGGSNINIPAQAQCRMSGFEVNIVGPGGGSTATFSSGAGYFQIGADDGNGTNVQLVPQAGGPGSACGQYPVVIGDTSNIVYGLPTITYGTGGSGPPDPYSQQNFGLAAPAAPTPAFYATFLGINDVNGDAGRVELFLSNRLDYPQTCYATLYNTPPGESNEAVIQLPPNDPDTGYQADVTWAVPPGTYSGSVYSENQDGFTATVDWPWIPVPGALPGPWGPPPGHHLHHKPTPPGSPG